MARFGGGAPNLGGTFLQGAAVSTDAARANTESQRMIADTMLGRQRNEIGQAGVEVQQGQLQLQQQQAEAQQKQQMAAQAGAELNTIVQTLQATAKIDPMRAQALMQTFKQGGVYSGVLARYNMATGLDITPEQFEAKVGAMIGAVQTPVQAAAASGDAARAQMRAELGRDPT